MSEANLSRGPEFHEMSLGASPLSASSGTSSARLSSSVSSVDSLLAPAINEVGPIPLQPEHPTRSAPKPPILSPKKGTPTIPELRKMRGPSVEEVLNGGCVSPDDRSLQSGQSPHKRVENSSPYSLSRLASTQFFAEMGESGILTAEIMRAENRLIDKSTTTIDIANRANMNEAHKPPADEDMEHKTTYAVENVFSTPQSLLPSSPSPRQEDIVACPPSDDIANFRPPNSPKEFARVVQSTRSEAGTYSIPPPLVSPAGYPAKTKEESSAQFEQRPDHSPLWTQSCLREGPAKDLKECNINDINSLQFGFTLNSTHRSRVAIPVTRILEEEGRSIVAGEAMIWRQRYEDMEKKMKALAKRLDQLPLERQAFNDASSGLWRAEKNLFSGGGAIYSQPSAGKGFGPASALERQGTQSQNRCKTSESQEPRSLTPQSPSCGRAFASTGTEVEAPLSEAEGERTPRLRGLSAAGIATPSDQEKSSSQEILRRPQSSPRSPIEQKVKIEESTLTRQRESEKDILVFDAVGLSEGVTDPTTENDGKTVTQDNLHLVVAERKARELQQQLCTANEEIAALRADVDRQKFQRDDLETQMITREEQLLSEKALLEEEMAALRAAVEQKTASAVPVLPIDLERARRNTDVILALQQLVKRSEPLAEEASSYSTKLERTVPLNEVEKILTTFCSPMDKCLRSASADTHSEETEPTLIPQVSEFLRIFVNELAASLGPSYDELAKIAEVPNSNAKEHATTLLKGGRRVAEIVREAFDTQSMQAAELREELMVVRKDRNELIGQQSEQVRSLQEELLEKDTEYLQLLERDAATQETLKSVMGERDNLLSLRESVLQQRPEKEEMGATPAKRESRSAAVQTDQATDDTLRDELKTKYETEKRDACKALEMKLIEARAGARAAQRVQRDALTEQLSSLREELRSTRAEARSVAAQHVVEVTRLHKQLDETRAALQTKELSLSIALREEVRRGHPPVASSMPVRGDEEAAVLFEPIKIEPDARAASYSFTSQGNSVGGSAGATQRVPSVSHSKSSGSGNRGDSDTAIEQTPDPAAPTSPRIADALPRLSNGSSEKAGSLSPSVKSPSPIAGSEERTGRDTLRSPPVAAALTDWVMGEPQSAPLLASRRAPSRPAPDPQPITAVPPSMPRRVTFVGVSPLTPSPIPSDAAQHSPLGMSDLDASGWARSVSRSLSPSFAASPQNTAFVNERSGTSSAEKENTSADTVDLAPLLSRTTQSGSSPLLAQTRSRLNSDGAEKSKRHRFVKMGSLQRMRDVWARQESLLMQSPPSSVKETKDGSAA